MMEKTCFGRCFGIFFWAYQPHDSDVASLVATVPAGTPTFWEVSSWVAMGPVIASIHEKRDEFREQIELEGALTYKPKLRTSTSER